MKNEERWELLTLPVRISPYAAHLAFAPNGNSVAALSTQEDRLVRVFHAPSMKEIIEAQRTARQEADQRPVASPEDFSLSQQNAETRPN